MRILKKILPFLCVVLLCYPISAENSWYKVSDIVQLCEGFDKRDLETISNNTEPLNDDGIVPKGDNCIICLDDFGPKDNARVHVILSCTHEYHLDCLSHWILDGNGKCPMCRADISSGQVSDNVFEIARAEVTKKRRQRILIGGSVIAFLALCAGIKYKKYLDQKDLERRMLPNFKKQEFNFDSYKMNNLFS